MRTDTPKRSHQIAVYGRGSRLFGPRDLSAYGGGEWGRSALVRLWLTLVRLWLASASALNSLMSKSIVTRSHAHADAVKATLHAYADNVSLGEALRLLDDRHVCVETICAASPSTWVARYSRS